MTAIDTVSEAARRAFEEGKAQAVTAQSILIGTVLRDEPAAFDRLVRAIIMGASEAERLGLCNRPTTDHRR